VQVGDLVWHKIWKMPVLLLHYFEESVGNGKYWEAVIDGERTMVNADELIEKNIESR